MDKEKIKEEVRNLSKEEQDEIITEIMKQRKPRGSAQKEIKGWSWKNL